MSKGDGGNDICPAMKLSENDVVFVRRNYAMEKIIAHGYWKGQTIEIRAKVKNKINNTNLFLQKRQLKQKLFK